MHWPIPQGHVNARRPVLTLLVLLTLFVSIAQPPGLRAAPFAQPHYPPVPIPIYWVDYGINHYQRYQPEDDFTSRFHPLFPVPEPGRILILMPPGPGLSVSAMASALERQLRDGLQHGATSFEIRTVQRVGTLGYLDYIETQPGAVAFTTTFFRALDQAAGRLRSEASFVTYGVAGSNGGNAATEAIAALASEGIRPLHALTLVDARASLGSTQRTIDALEGRVTLINTRGDFPASPSTVASFIGARTLVSRNPEIGYFIVDASPDGLTLSPLQAHLAAMEPGDLVAHQHGADGFGPGRRLAGAQLLDAVIAGPPPSGVPALDPHELPLLAAPDRERRPAPPPPPPGGGSAAAGPGGVDFTTVDLRYLAALPDDDAEALAIVVRAPLASGGAVTLDGPGLGLATAALQAWLQIDPAKAWVNLHPQEPDRIADPALVAAPGRVAQIMLEADLRMKQTVAELIHPDTVNGTQFWGALYALADARNSSLCFGSRLWITPGATEVVSTPRSITIVRAELDVQLESQRPHPDTGDAHGGCPDVDETTKSRAEALYRRLVLPGLIDRVNHGLEYAELRSIYHARVIAEWVREHAAHVTLPAAGALPVPANWSPREVWQRYVDSVTAGEFDLTRTTVEGNLIVTRRYLYGGVDFTSPPLVRDLTFGELEVAEPGIDDVLLTALRSPAEVEDGGYLYRGVLLRPGDPLLGLPRVDTAAAGERRLATAGASALPDTATPLGILALAALLLAWRLACVRAARVY